jgi:DNA-binding NarL/FixJ family response regulator
MWSQHSTQRRSRISTEKSKVTSLSAASILVIESQEIEARGIKSALLSRGCSTVHYCFTPDEALSLIPSAKFDLILLNRQIGSHDGIALVIELRKLAPASTIVMLSPETPWSLAEEVQNSGANGLFSKSISLPTLIDALADLIQHSERFIFIGNRFTGERLDELTLSEREVLTQLSAGLTTREIAKKRHNSEATIKSHLTSIYRKLGVRNRVEAIAHLYR